jgi:hypothetical protein
VQLDALNPYAAWQLTVSWGPSSSICDRFHHRSPGARMDRKGRFDFWGMLLHTRAITPPAIQSRWVQRTRQRLPAWLVVPVIMVLAIGAALYARNPTVSAYGGSQPKAISAAVPIQPSRPW